MYYACCEWSKRMRFAMVKKVFADSHRNTWEQKTTGVVKAASKATEPTKAAGKAGQPVPTIPKAKAAPKAKSSLANALAVKTLYTTAETKANHQLELLQLSENVAEKRAYESDMKTALQELTEAKSKDTFFGQFLAKDAADVKVSWPDEDKLEGPCGRFSDQVKPAAEKLTKLINTVTTVMRARTRAEAPAVPKAKKQKTK